MLYRITIISFAVCLFSIQDIGYAQLFDYRAGKMIVNVTHNQKLAVTTNNKGIPVLGITQLYSLNDFYKCISIDRVYYGSHPDTKNLFLFSFKADSDILELSGKYSINSLSYAEPDFLFETAETPDDPLYSSQWGLPKIEAPAAWDIEKGSPDVVISINDTGLDWQHPDLQSNLWINSQEDLNGNGIFDNFASGSGGDIDGIDNDQNGYVDDVIGWNFNNNNNDPQHISGSHGTNVASTVAAVTNNDEGVAGISWNSKIMACRTGDDNSISSSAAIAAIYYAVDNGANIINMSWGSTVLLSGLNTAILYAANNDVVMTAAAMNANTSTPYYPAAHDSVIGVAALNQDDTKYSSSNFGTWVNVSAPRFNHYCNYVSGDPDPHQYASGGATSTASPFVAGLAALIFSLNSDIHDHEVRNIIFATADNIDSVNPSYTGLLGAGRINAYEALRYTLENYGGTLRDEVTITEDLTINSGATLYIDAGATIAFASASTDLWVEGQIIAKGTSSNPITFTAQAGSPSRSEWGTIFVESDDNVFEHCTVEYSDLGIKIYDTTYLTGNVVKNCTIENNDQGLRFQNADVTVENNTIRDNRHGVVAINADGLFTGNSTYNNDRDGIYAVNGTLDFFSNNIYSNGLGQSGTIHGIYAASGSDVNVGGAFGTYGNPGYNEIFSNKGSGVHVDNSSAAFMGHKVGYGGYNSVYSNGVYSGYDANNLNSSATVEAHKNWWGTSSPSSSQFNGDVDYTFYLTSPPAVPKASGTTTRTLITSSISNKTVLVDSLKTAASTDSKTANRSTALMFYYSIVRRDKNDALDEKSTAISFLNARLAAESDDMIKSQAFIFLLDAYLDQSQNQAVLNSIATLPGYLSASHTQTAYSYGIFANVSLGDYAAADKLMQTYQKQFPKASEIVFLQEYINGARGIFADQNAADELAKSAESTSQTDGMLVAYPNPFNPSTHIRYALPHTGEVSIRIFNLLGEKVRDWQIATKPAGAHTLLWDGTDAHGVEVSSGVYLLQISYRSFENGALQVVQSRKLTLVR